MTITENLTGVVKEDHERVKTVTDILEEVRTEMCDGYCVYPRITPNDYEKYKSPEWALEEQQDNVKIEDDNKTIQKSKFTL